MENFVYNITTRYVFGRDTHLQAGEQVAAFGGKKVLIHYGSRHAKASGLIDQVKESLDRAGIESVELGGVLPNPRLSLVYEGIELCRRQNVDFILAVGGGSVLDSAKAIGIGVPYGGDVWDCYDADINLVLSESLPTAVVLTIPGAGSESSGGSVITREEDNLKRDAKTPLCKFAILNPELTFTLPAYQTAAGGCDAIVHIMERYFSPVKDAYVVDRNAEALMASLMHLLPLAIENPDDYATRANIMWACTLAHNNSVGVGKINDFASHRIEHELSGLYDITHGAGLCIVIPAWMKFTYKHDLRRYADYAKGVFGIDDPAMPDEEKALAAIAETEAFFRSVGMPTRLSEAGIDDAHFEKMATLTERNAGSDKVGFFAQLSTADIVEILKLAL
ncbi:MAG: iron-containing alcohol dehydrogenase [Christensenellales bacterium]|jgi:alcohol dehydrogenase YqhD (iron-dependent ADH family)